MLRPRASTSGGQSSVSLGAVVALMGGKAKAEALLLLFVVPFIIAFHAAEEVHVLHLDIQTISIAHSKSLSYTACNLRLPIRPQDHALRHGLAIHIHLLLPHLSLLLSPLRFSRLLGRRI